MSLGAKLKGMNWKTFLIDHCEKFVVVLIGLFVLTSLGMTRWGTYKTQPEEFTEKVTKGKNNFVNSKWPEDRKTEFEARDLGDVVAGVIDGVPFSSKYEPSTPWVRPVHAERKPIVEPKFEKAQETIAHASKVLIEFMPEQSATSGMLVAVDSSSTPTTAQKSGNEESDIPRPRIDGPRQPAGNGPGTSGIPADGHGTPGGAHGAGASGAHGAGGGGHGQPAGPTRRRGPGGATPGMAHGDAAVATDPSQMYGMDMYGAGGMARKDVNAKGYRFVAVRAVFPMKLQLENIRKALNLESVAQALEYVNLWNFELQRQAATTGADPWADDAWETIDIQTATDILSRSEFDTDVVEERYRDAVITMPLPYRVTGRWGTLASHPQIKRLLTEEEAARQEARNKAAIETAEKMKTSTSTQKGGFQGLQHDIRGIQQRIQRSDPSVMNMYMGSVSQYESEAMGIDPSQYGNAMASDPRMMMGAGGGMGMGQIVSIPELLLFRYLDFDVVPGNAYRYRIKLQFKNPNYQRDAGELANPESASGEYRYSDWSDPSNPVVVDDDLQLFVAKVSQAGAISSADIEAYDWMTETGSYVKGEFKKVIRGEQIAAHVVEKIERNQTVKEGGITTEVLRPAQMTFEEESIDYVTPNIVIDMGLTTMLNAEDHPDLDLGNKRFPLRMEEVVMVNRFGEVVEFNKLAQDATRKNSEAIIKEQGDVWAHLKRSAQPAGAAAGLEGLLGSAAGAQQGYDQMMMGMGMPGGGKQRSSLKRGARGTNSKGGAMMGPMGMPMP